MAAIMLPLAMLTAIWIAILPWANRDLSQRALFDPATFVAYVYLLFYSFAVIIGSICFYNLSAKRFRARARPASLAGLSPLAFLFLGAANWLQPRSEGFVSPAIPLAFAALAFVIVAWTVVDLGFRTDGQGQ